MVCGEYLKELVLNRFVIYVFESLPLQHAEEDFTIGFG